jgi:DnaD/phage-associated family protein
MEIFMNYITVTTETNETFSSISNYFIDYYMTDASGEFVKVYLYLVRLLSSKSPISIAGIADHFNLTETDICRAVKYWISKEVLRLTYDASGRFTGIVLLPLRKLESDETTGPLSLDNIPQMEAQQITPMRHTLKQTGAASRPVTAMAGSYTASPAVQEKSLPEKQVYSREMADKATADEAFADIIYETETYFGKQLSVNDIESLVYMYDQLDLSAEMLEYLIEYCASINKSSLRYAEAIARSWYQKGIKTVDEAKQDVNSYNPLYRAVFKALGIDRKNPNVNEIAFMDSWSKDMGFDQSIIIEACNRGIERKPHSVTFAYINRILDDWSKKGVKSISDIDALDKQFYETREKEKASKKTASGNRKNSFNTFEQTDMSSQLDEMEKLLLDEINL